MSNIDPNLKDFLMALNAQFDKSEYKKKRGDLRRNSAGFPREFELHHIIPITISQHWVVNHADKAGWKVNDDNHNGIPLPNNLENSKLFGAPMHRRGADHPKYTKEVAELLDEIEIRGRKEGWNDRRVRNELEVLVIKVILTIREMKEGQYIDDITFSSPSTCYIATATLTGGGSEAQLNILRAWRDRVLSATSFGRSLEAFYDRTGPQVARHVKYNEILANSFLYPFVKPAIWLVEKRSKHLSFAAFFDLAIYVVFLTGLVYGTVVYLIHPNR